METMEEGLKVEVEMKKMERERMEGERVEMAATAAAVVDLSRFTVEQES